MSFGIWIVTAFLVFSVASSYELPRSQWCQDLETAKKHGVEKECFPPMESDSPDKLPVLTLSVAYETHCPDSQDFITKQLWEVFKELKPPSKDYVKLEMLPYGKASEKFNEATGQWEFQCQHGPRECYGNLAQTCAIETTKGDPSKYLPFIHCMELARDPMAAGQRCAIENKMDLKLIADCVSGNMGNVLQHKVALATKKLANPLTYVPWIAINGKHNKNAEFNLKAEICAALPEPKPTKCQENL